MVRKFLFVVLVVFQATLAFASDSVIFQGSVNRHPALDKNVEFAGEIRFHYGFGDEDFVVQPFVLPAGQSSISYSRELDWALVDVDNGKGHYWVSVSCVENCQLAGASRLESFYLNDSSTSFRFDVRRVTGEEEFGREQRSASYIVDLVALPNQSLISGRLVLPNDLVTTEPLKIRLVWSSYGVTSFNTSFKSVEMPAGATELPFSIQIDLDQSHGGNSGNTVVLSYECESAACRDLGLAPYGWVDMRTGAISGSMLDALSVLSRSSPLADGSSEDAFFLAISPAIEMAPLVPKLVKIMRESGAATKVPVSGRVILEKLGARGRCLDGQAEVVPPVPEQQDFLCPFITFSTPATLITREVPFEIPVDESMVNIMLPVDTTVNRTIDNNSRFAVFQRVRVICEQGCSSRVMEMSGQGLYFSQGRPSLTPVSAATNYFTPDSLLSDEIVVTLQLPLVVTPAIDLLMDE